MPANESISRRDLLRTAGVIGVGMFVAGRSVFEAQAARDERVGAPGVSPTEDLMREHGALDRIMLIYDEGLRRMAAVQPMEPGVIVTCASLVRKFIEDYHEKLEEDHIFPLIRKAGKLTDLVDALLTQHKAGRVVTDQIANNAKFVAAQSLDDRARIVQPLREFIRMYRPHAAREDTILFPALHDLMTEKEFDEMGDRFEDREHELFGAPGFEGIVAQIAEIEKSLDLYNISNFTPAVQIPA